MCVGGEGGGHTPEPISGTQPMLAPHILAGEFYQAPACPLSVLPARMMPEIMVGLREKRAVFSQLLFGDGGMGAAGVQSGAASSIPTPCREGSSSFNLLHTRLWQENDHLDVSVGLLSFKQVVLRPKTKHFPLLDHHSECLRMTFRTGISIPSGQGRLHCIPIFRFWVKKKQAPLRK